MGSDSFDAERPIGDPRAPTENSIVSRVQRIRISLLCKECNLEWDGWTPYWWAVDGEAHPCVEAGHPISFTKIGG